MIKKNGCKLSMKILIVDDAVAVRRQVFRVLDEMGFKSILEAGSVAEAWSIIERNRGEEIKLIFSDWHMPGETGLDLLKKIRSHPKFNKIPFIMLTTEQEKSKIIEAAHFGLQGY
ncbi:MAG: response regulator [Fibrobacter sp.]|nr:response regulator [Fibrobacter sp.]